jgi:hypothetical protein
MKGAQQINSEILVSTKLAAAKVEAFFAVRKKCEKSAVDGCRKNIWAP